MTHKEKIKWMQDYALKNNVQLTLEGEVGFGRKCVGILLNGSYPDYEWYDEHWEKEDDNGNVWTPVDAYHKHPCVAVLGRGEEAESQLFEWLKWFDNNNFKIEEEANTNKNLHPIELMMGRITTKRMIKQ